MKIDTKVRHVTKPGDNIFRDLGFSKTEADRLYAASEKQIDEMRQLKQQLMTELSTWISDNGLKQDEAAAVLKVSRPRVSDVVTLKTGKFTIDTLIGMLIRIGKPVRLAVK